ncbi:O-antigen ligase family protein [bacterium]|nr:O-antigen ligase family protein [bacterium]
MTALKFSNINPFIGIFLVGTMGIFLGSIFSFVMNISLQYTIILGTILIVSGLCLYTGKTKQILTTIMLVTIPINVDKSLFLNEAHTGGVKGLVISIWSIALIILYFVWFFESWYGKERKTYSFPRITIPMGLLICISILSILKSVNISLSIFAIVQMLNVFLLFFYIANNVRSEKEYQFIIFVLFAIFFFEIVLGYFQYFMNKFVDLNIFSDVEKASTRELASRKIVTVSGTLTGDARFGDYLSLMLFLVLGSVISKIKLYKRVIFIPMFAAGIMLLIFTFSRGAWIGFGSGLFLFLLLKMMFNLKNPRMYISLLLFVLIALTVTFVFKDLIAERFYGEDYGSAESRIPMMQIGFEIIKKNPLLGIGMNNYTRVMALYDPTGLSYVWHHPVHNVFIQLTAEIGIFGLIVFLWINTTVYVIGIKFIKNSNEFYQNQMTGLIAGITAVLVHGMVNNGTIDTDPFILFWALVGLIFAISKINENIFIKGTRIIQ